MGDKYQKHNFDFKPERASPVEPRVVTRAPSSLFGSPITIESSGKYLTIALKYSFFAVMFFMFSLVFLIVLQSMGFKTFSFLPDDGGAIPIPYLPTNRQIAFPTSIMAADASANLINLVSSKYTVSLDVFIESDFVNQSVPRVLLYRSANNVVLTASDTSIEEIILKMPQTNFILYLDPYTNDLMAEIIFLPTTNGSPTGSSSGIPSGIPSGRAGARPNQIQKTADRTLLDSLNITTISMPPITNVPIRTPFRITMMLSESLLEVYINGDLQKSVPFLGNTMRLVPTATPFYGPPTIVGRAVHVSNISYWNTPLSSKAIRTYGKETLNAAVFSK